MMVTDTAMHGDEGIPHVNDDDEMQEENEEDFPVESSQHEHGKKTLRMTPRLHLTVMNDRHHNMEFLDAYVELLPRM